MKKYIWIFLIAQYNYIFNSEATPLLQRSLSSHTDRSATQTSPNNSPSSQDTALYSSIIYQNNQLALPIGLDHENSQDTTSNHSLSVDNNNVPRSENTIPYHYTTHQNNQFKLPIESDYEDSNQDTTSNHSLDRDHQNQNSMCRGYCILGTIFVITFGLGSAAQSFYNH